MGGRKLNYKRAVALAYQPDTEDAPSVSALGDALQAEEIVRLARRFGVPLVENAPLAQALAQLAPDQPIPENLYQAVAIILNELEQQPKKS